MEEIGGYLEFDQLINRPYHQNMIELNSGRNALLYLIRAKNIKKVYLPSYLCDTIYKTLEKNDINYELYRIEHDFSPAFKTELQKDDYLYLVNYFGQFNTHCVEEFKRKYNNIILDNTQNFFQRPPSEIDTLYSCRKYFGIPDGAYLSTNKLIDEELEEDSSSSRFTHLLGRYEGKASDFYRDFKNNGERIDNLQLKNMSRLTKNLLGAIDYEGVIKARNRNFNYLQSRLAGKNKLKVSDVFGAFSYPFYVENGIEIRKKLAERLIYIPTLWPNVLEQSEKDSIEYDYTANILPLPCDQRYEIEDMKRIVKEIEECIN